MNFPQQFEHPSSISPSHRRSPPPRRRIRAVAGRASPPPALAQHRHRWISI
jgi:hypothetical protein